MKKNRVTPPRFLIVPNKIDFEDQMWFHNSRNVTVTAITNEQMHVLLDTAFLDINDELDLLIGSDEEEWIHYDQIDKALEICNRWLGKLKKQTCIDGLNKVIYMLNLAKEKKTCLQLNL